LRNRWTVLLQNDGCRDQLGDSGSKALDICDGAQAHSTGRAGIRPLLLENAARVSKERPVEEHQREEVLHRLHDGHIASVGSKAGFAPLEILRESKPQKNRAQRPHLGRPQRGLIEELVDRFTHSPDGSVERCQGWKALTTMNGSDPSVAGLSGTDQEELEKIGRRWEYATTSWNVLEATVSIVTGVLASSLALVAFGLDSTIEVFASLVVLWHLTGEDESTDPIRAKRAMRLLAIAFGLLGVYLVVDSIHGLASHTEATTSPLGMIFLGATVVIMFVFAWAKRRTGLALGNRPLIANARMAAIDGMLAAGILLALGLDALLGWWWADPVAAGVVALITLNEARELWWGE
jgi:Cation efflux family